MVIDHSKWISRTETAVLLDVDKTTVELWERFQKMPYKSVNIKGTNYDVEAYFQLTMDDD